MTRDRAGLRVLSGEECLHRLGDHRPRIGRVAFVQDGRVVVLPVNYRIDGGDIVFRTGADTMLARLPAGQEVSFQADEVDTTWAEGWSVLVQGTARPVTEMDDLEHLHGLPLHPWAPGEKNVFVRITPETVTGRMIE